MTAVLTCEQCQATQVVATGFTAMQMATGELNEGQWRANAEKLAWTFNPTVCPSCRGVKRWGDAVGVALRKPKPAEGWPK